MAGAPSASPGSQSFYGIRILSAMSSGLSPPKNILHAMCGMRRARRATQRLWRRKKMVPFPGLTKAIPG